MEEFRTKQSELSSEAQAVDREYAQKMTMISLRPRLVRAGFLAWFSVVVCMGLFYAGSVLWYGADGVFADERLVVSVLENSQTLSDFFQKRAPREVSFGKAQFLPSSSKGFYDAIISVTNENPRHGAVMNYHIVVDGVDGERGELLINPGETTAIFASRVSTARPKTAEVRVDDISWVYLSRQDVEDVSVWKKDHEALVVENPIFSREVAYDGSFLGRATFTVENRSPYGYRDAVFFVTLLRGSTPIAVTQIAKSSLTSQEKAFFDVRFLGDLPETAVVQVIPHVPYFSPEYILSPEETSILDARTFEVVN